MTSLWLALAVLGLASSAGFFVWVNDGWAQLTGPVKLLRVGCLLLMIAVTYGSGEAYVQAAPIGLRLPFVALAFAVILLGVVLIYRDRLH